MRFDTGGPISKYACMWYIICKAQCRVGMTAPVKLYQQSVKYNQWMRQYWIQIMLRVTEVVDGHFDS